MNSKMIQTKVLPFLIGVGMLLIGACSSRDDLGGRVPASHGQIKYKSMADRDPNRTPWGLRAMDKNPSESTEFVVSPLTAPNAGGSGDANEERPLALGFNDSKLFPKLTDFLGKITVEKDIYYGREKIISKGSYTWFGFLDLHGEAITRIVGRDMPGWQERMKSNPQAVLEEASQKLNEAKVMEKTVQVGSNSVPFEDVYWTMINGMQALSGMEVTPRRRTVDEKPKFYAQYVRENDGRIKAKVFKSTKQLK